MTSHNMAANETTPQTATEETSKAQESIRIAICPKTISFGHAESDLKTNAERAGVRAHVLGGSTQVH